MLKNKPNFFIFGGPKCGTTALAQYLLEHPEAFMSKPKEPHHYNTDIDNSELRDRDEYLALFDGVKPNHKAIGEASVWYLYSKVAAQNIENDIPDAKYIVMLRNPVDMVYSLHEQILFSNFENITNFEAAWNLQELRRQGAHIPPFCSDAALLLYRETCSLGSQLEHLLVTVDPKRVLILFQEDLKSNPRALWKNVQGFLGIVDDGRQDFPVVNAAKKRRSRLLKGVNDAYVAIRKRFNLKPLGTGVFEMINKWNIKERPRAPIREEFRQELSREFLEEVKKLEHFTGRNLHHWYPQSSEIFK